MARISPAKGRDPSPCVPAGPTPSRLKTERQRKHPRGITVSVAARDVTTRTYRRMFRRVSRRARRLSTASSSRGAIASRAIQFGVVKPLPGPTMPRYNRDQTRAALVQLETTPAGDVQKSGEGSPGGWCSLGASSNKGVPGQAAYSGSASKRCVNVTWAYSLRAGITRPVPSHHGCSNLLQSSRRLLGRIRVTTICGGQRDRRQGRVDGDESRMIRVARRTRVAVVAAGLS